MPYIICVNQPGYLPEADPIAVATLQEARDTAREEVNHRVENAGCGARLCAETGRIPEAGGTVGPLPDGYVIEVRKVGWIELAQLCGMDCGTLCAGPNDHVLDAYNKGY